MSQIVFNASAVPLTSNPGTLPNMGGAMLDYFQPMVFTNVAKSVVGFQNVETPTTVNFQGVWQPFTDQQLNMRPEGQRQWLWFTLHADPSLALMPDDVLDYLNVQYRVMMKRDYTEYGYIEYHLVNDYTGSGP